VRIPVAVIVAFLVGFYLATTSAAPYFRHLVSAIGHAIAHL
jgi:hypothetical protein